MESILPTHPETNRQLLKRSFILYSASFSKVYILALLLSLTAFIPRIISDAMGRDIFMDLPPLSPYRLSLVLIHIIVLLFFIAIFWHMHCIAKRIREPLKEDMVVGLRKVFYVFITAFIQGLIIFAVAAAIYGTQILMHQYNLLFSKHLLGALLSCCILIGQFLLILYVSTLFYFIVPIIAVENKGIFQSIEKSILLVWNHWWRTFSLQITPWVFYLLILLVIRMVFKIDIHIYFANHVQPNFSSTILNLILFALFIPWVAALLLVQLKDLELRRKTLGKINAE